MKSYEKGFVCQTQELETIPIDFFPFGRCASSKLKAD